LFVCSFVCLFVRLFVCFIASFPFLGFVSFRLFYSV
jgi:hypothetical protein